MDLQPGERVIYEGRPSWRSVIGFYNLRLLAAGAGAAIAAAASGTGLAVAVGAGILLLALLIGWLRRLATRYLITTRRLQIRRGILSRHVEESRVERVVDVTIHQSVLDRVLL